MSAGQPADILRAGLDALECPLEPERIGLLETYLALLQRWNRTYSLTAVRKPEDMVVRHLLDSLSVLNLVRGRRLLDAGTGAGLPGIPLAIVRPEWEFTLLDSGGKKVRFLNQVKRALDLRNVAPVQARLESFADERGFDTIISRALTRLADFAGAARGLLSPATRLCAMKGRYPGGELEALPPWIKVEAVKKLVVPGLQEERHLVIMCVNA
jgi:16S rRNA (guanine527-N7)-methyltransferase